jgi:hypothetical protein
MACHCKSCPSWCTPWLLADGLQKAQALRRMHGSHGGACRPANLQPFEGLGPRSSVLKGLGRPSVALFCCLLLLWSQGLAAAVSTQGHIPHMPAGPAKTVERSQPVSQTL